MADDRISKNLHLVYSALKSEGYTDIGDEQDFIKKMQDEQNRLKVYNALKGAGYSDMGSDFKSFSGMIYTAPQPKPQSSAAPAASPQSSPTTIQTNVVQPVVQTPATQQQPTSAAPREVKKGDGSMLMAPKQEQPSFKFNFTAQTYHGVPMLQNDEKGNPKVSGGTFNPVTGQYGGEGSFYTDWLGNKIPVNSDYGKAAVAYQQHVKDVSPINAELEEAYKERDRINKMLSDRMGEIDKAENDQPWYIQMMTEGARAYAGDKMGGYGSATDYQLKYNSDQKYRNIMSAARKNRAAIKALEDKKNGKQNEFWHAFGNAITNGYTFSQGDSDWGDVNALIDAQKHMPEIERKQKTGEKLTKDEEIAATVIKNHAWDNDVQQRYGDEYGAWARAGETAVGSLELGIDFLTMGPELKATAGSVMKLTEKGATKVLGDAATKGLGKYMTKATGVTVGSMIAGAEMSNTVGLNRTMSDVGKRSLGNVTVNEEDGSYQFDGGKGFLQSLYEAEMAASIENGSEVLGEFLPGSGMLLKGLEKVGMKKVANGLTRLGGSTWYKNYTKALESIGFHGVGGEAVEEYAGLLGNALLVGDNKFSDLLDPKTHVDIWLGCAVTGGLLNAPRTVGYAAQGANKGYQAAQYYRYKHKTDKSDAAANAVWGDEWVDLRDRIDGTSNEDMTDIATSIYTDADMTPEQKRTALDYIGNLTAMRGYNMGRISMEREDENGRGTTDDERSLNNAFATGYNATEQEDMEDAKNAYDMHRQLAENSLDEWTLSALDGNETGIDGEPLNPLHILGNMAYSPIVGDAMTDEQRKIAADYLNAKARYDGMLQRVRDDIDSRISASDAAIDQRTNRVGLIQPATMKLDDRRVYVVDGNLVMHDDGSMIDIANSDESILVRDAETGKLEWASPHDFLSVDEEIDPAAEKEAAQAAIREQYAEEQAQKIDGALPFNDGDIYSVMEEDGTQWTAQILADNGDGTVQVAWNGNVNNPQTVSKDFVQELSTNAAMARLAQNEQERAMQEQLDKEDEFQQERPVYNLNDEVTLRGENGEPVRGSITTEENEDGQIEVYTETPINGKKIHMFTRQQIDDMLMEHNGEAVVVPEAPAITAEIDNAGSVQSEPSTVQNDVENVPETTENVPNNDENVQTAEETVAVEPMPMVGEGEYAEPDFGATTPQRAHDYIFNESGLEEADAAAFTKNNVEAANKELEKIKNKKPKMGTSIAKFNKDKAEWEQKVNEAQAKADYWKQVKEARDKVLAQRLAEQHERERQQIEQAQADEAAYREEMARKEAEQAALGTNNVSPAIRDKWVNAPKVEGAQDEIVLPNGEKVAGRYYLVESGAASASHDSNNGFAKTEGFPVDENGGSVNDRDYERDMDAQRITRDIANNYDSRAVQTPVVVSQDGVVLSGNGRTMAGELAAAQNTDAAYNSHIAQYPTKWGFTQQQVEGMQHPRVVFVPDAAMPYTAETFAKFNQQEMKGQSKTEQAVKLGKVVSDKAFNRIIGIINRFDTLGDFYADSKATSEAITELQGDGVLSQAQMAEMYDGDGISAIGKELLENTLIGKAFESNPNAVREITEYKSMRQSIITALAEISNNLSLGKEYSLESELAQAIDLVYQARNGGSKFGEPVSWFARQQNLDFFGFSDTVADYNNATMLMISDIINDNRSSRLKKYLQIYNYNAQDSANGQLDLFTGSVHSKEDIINEVKQLFNNGSEEEQQKAAQEAVARRKAESVQENGTVANGSEAEPAGEVTETPAVAEGVETPATEAPTMSLDNKRAIIQQYLMEMDGATELLNVMSEDEMDLFMNAMDAWEVANEEYGNMMQYFEPDLKSKNKETVEHAKARIKGAHDVADERFAVVEQLHNNLCEKYNISTEEAETPTAEPTGTVASKYDEAKEFYRKNYSLQPLLAQLRDQQRFVREGRGDENVVRAILDILNEDYGNGEQNDLATAIAAAEAATEANPTDAQKEAGNYKKGHVKVDDFDITIENAKGSTRSGKDADGKEWSVTMNNTYGYIRGTEGVDGDHIDIYLSDDPSNGNVFVIDQVKADGTFDEHKVMYGFASAEEARDNYLANYSEGWTGLGTISEVTKDEFKKWTESSHRKTKPFAEYSSVKPLGDTQLGEQLNKPTVKAGEDYVSAAERIAREDEVKRTAAHFAEETQEEATAFDKRVPEMDDVELLAYMQEDGRGDLNKAYHPSVYDEYDYRHGDEQLQSYDDTLVRLNESGTTLEQAEEMLANIQKDVSRLATEDRAMLLGQEDALQEYIAGLEKEGGRDVAIPSQQTEQNESDTTSSTINGNGRLPEPRRKNAQGSGKKSSSDGKIDDVGEVLAGARKDMRKEIAKSLANVTEAALVEKPFGKVYKNPDLKKAVESGALREKDAIFYEALFSMVNQQKPKVTQSEMRSKRYIPDHKTKAERWAADTFKQMEVLRQFMELDEPGRDAMMERMLADRYPTREQELAEIEKRKGWNPDYEGHKYEWGEMTTPNPLWVTHEVMNRLGYSVGDKLDVPYGVVKANTSGTGYSIENLKGERASLFGSGMTLDEAIDRIVYLAKLKRGDADVSHPTQLFAFPATKSESGESGRYRVMWGRDYKTREFDSKDEADAFAQTKNGAYVSPIMETKRRFGYKVRFIHPLTGEKMFVDDTEFDTKEEAQAYFDGNFEKLNEATNAKLQEEREKKGEKKTLTADDVVHVTMVHSGKGGWTHAVVIDKKYANNDGQVRIIKEGFASRKDAKSFADSVKDDVLKTVLKHKEDAKKIVYFDTGENSRIGEDYRNGKNVDAEDFMNTFGFRGVQFGNWTNQADRQMAVNQAYDAFMDMARLIGVSPKAMSLNGELGIAFGARGVGGFAAHYEPGEVVINLTKTQGAGSLAHEWWHALDNYFARRAGSAGDMVTDNRRIEMRDALRKAFNDMLDLVNGSDYAQRSAAKGEYWGRTHEITARLLAEWVDRELKKRGELNTFLSRGAVVERGQQHNYDVYEVLERLAGREPMPFEEYKELPESLKGIPYPSAKEVEQFGGSLRHIFDTLEEKVDEETGNVMLYEPTATYETRDGGKVVCRSLFDEMGVRDEGETTETSPQNGEAPDSTSFNPSELRLRKLKKGETCHVERVYEETKQFDFTGKEKVESAEDVAYIFRQLENAAVENSFLVLVKDGRPTVIHLGMGGYVSVMAPYEQALVAYRELKPEQVYFVHNHPSGVLKASRQDQELLKRVKMAFGEDVVQQGIIIDTTSGKYGEFDMVADNYDLVQTSGVEAMPQSDGADVPVKVYQFSRQVFAPDWNPESAFKIVSSQSVAEFVSSHRLGEHKKMSFLVVNNSGNVVANVFLPWTKLSDIKRSKAGDLLAGYVHQCGGVRGVLYGNYDYEADDRAVLAAVGGRMRQLNAPLMDALHVEHSAYESGWAGVGEPGVGYGVDARDVAQGIDDNNGTEVVRFIDFLRRGRLEQGESRYFHVGETGDILNEHGISGKITIGTSAVNSHHNEDADHLDENDWVEVIEKINEPVAITEYGDKGNSYRIYTIVEKNGKNICVGVDVNSVGRDVNITNIRTAFARDIANALNERLDYPHSRTELETAIRELSLRHNREVYPEQPYDAANIRKNSETQAQNEENLLLGRDGLDKLPQQSRRVYTTKERRDREAYAERQWRRAHEVANEIIDKLNISDDITVYESIDEVPGSEDFSSKRRRSKGWYDPRTNKIVVVLGNHRSPNDVLQTILHEAVAHYGLRKLFGKNFETFLDNVYKHADMEVRRRIIGMASNKGWDIREATEEYLASLAEDTDFDNAEIRSWAGHWFNKIKQLFLDMLHHIGLRDYDGVSLSDNELRYILWRSYKNLVEPGHYRNYFSIAEDTVMQSNMHVGDFSEETGETIEQSTKVAESGLMFRDGEYDDDIEQDSTMQEDRDMMRSAVQQMGEKLHTNINIIEDVNEITHPNAAVQERRRKSKGWYDTATGQVNIVLDNNRDIDDVKASVGHETIAHKGLRELVGEENYDEFLDETYQHLRDDLKKGVDAAAGRAFIDDTTKNGKRAKSYEQHRRTAVDELFGRMAEKPFEEFSEGERTLWQKIKATVRRLLDKFLGSLKLPKWFEIGDNELRYILWRSKERLERGKEHPIDLARDIVKREELGLTDEARYNMGDAPETFKARQKRAVENNGTVMTGLNRAQVKVVGNIPRHTYTGNIAEATQQAIDEAKAKYVPNGEPRTLHYNNFGAEFDYSISGNAIETVLSAKHQGKSVNKGVHLALAEHLDRVIGESIEVEEHPDRIKTGDVRDNSKINPDALMHRFYGVANIDGVDYRVMTLMKEENKATRGNGIHSYEVQKIEVLDEETPNTSNGVGTLNSELEGYPLAKVIKDVGKTMEKDKNLLEQSKLADESTDLYREPDDTEDIWNDQSLGLQERITAAATRLANNHRDNKTLRNDAMRAIGGNLSDLRKAMSLQRTFDMTTVKRVADLARVLMNNGYLNGLTQQEVKRLLAAIKNSVGHNDIEGDVQKVMDIMVDNQLKHAEDTLHELEAIRGSKVDARGVEVQGQLDPAGAQTMKVLKKTRGWERTDIEEAISEAQQRMGSSDVAVADEAALEYTGLQLALEYSENIKDSKVEERKLREEIKQAHDDASERDRATDSYRQYIASLQEAIRQNKIERAQSYFDLVGRLSDSLRESIANAKNFKEAEKQRIREIQHNANSDMEGRASNEHYKPTFADKFVNNSFVSFLFAPLATFDQMLRMFGGKSANGEGYLYNRFMRGWVDARQKEINGVRDKYAILDAKAAELFGGKVKTWGDLIRRVGKLPKGTVSFWNGGEMQEREMTQGNLMYIYMVNKMLDGRMKLRKMGITEENVADIEEVLDPRLTALADWLQDEFLVQTRNEYNETHKRMFGASMAAIEHYFPLRVLKNAIDVKAEDLDKPEVTDGISTITGSIIKRRRNSKPLDILNADALHVILSHVAEMEHWNAYAEFNRDLNTLRSYRRFRNQVQNMNTIYGNGEVLWDKFNDVCQMATGAYKPKGDGIEKAVLSAAQGVTAAKVSFRNFTALKQFASLPAYIPYVRADYLVRSMARPDVSWSWCMEHLPIFEERWKSRVSGDPRLAKSILTAADWRQNLAVKIARAGMVPNAFVDALTVSMGAYAVYQTRKGQYLRDGYSEEQAERRAIQDAEIVYNETQQSGESAFTSTMQTDRTWWKG